MLYHELHLGPQGGGRNLTEAVAPWLPLEPTLVVSLSYTS